MKQWYAPCKCKIINKHKLQNKQHERLTEKIILLPNVLVLVIFELFNFRYSYRKLE